MRLLAADIGGTKSLLATFRVVDGVVVSATPTVELCSTDFVDAEALLRRFVATLDSPIDVAVLGVPGPVIEHRCTTTNLPWQLDAATLGATLGIPRIRLANDVEAAGYGLAALQPSDVVVLQEGSIDAEAPIALLGAGTGLGEAIVLPGRPLPRVLATEGGHTDFGPLSIEDLALWRFLQLRHGHVSYERILSGPGLIGLYEFAVNQGHATNGEVLQQGLPHQQSAEIIGTEARNGGDPACVWAVQKFVELLAAEAGNLALKTLAKGGIFIAGGVASKLAFSLCSPSFQRSFQSKGRMSALMNTFRVTLVRNRELGLLGARNLASVLVG